MTHTHSSSTQCQNWIGIELDEGQGLVARQCTLQIDHDGQCTVTMVTTNPIKTNIWHDNSYEEPPIEYKDLGEIISFEGFDFAKYREGEIEILEPQLKRIGYVDIEWHAGETDSFGPLTRVCKVKDHSGKSFWFIYG